MTVDPNPVLIYGYDPICGWCYGAVPAVRAVAEIIPVKLVMAGLVTGARVGPASEMEGYVRQASQRLKAVTGRAPSEAFFQWMARPGSIAASAPPAVAVHAVLQGSPDNACNFAHAVTEAHYEQGMDLNDPDAYRPLLERYAPTIQLPDIHDPQHANVAFREGRAMGITSFPTFLLQTDRGIEALPSVYNPDELVGLVRERTGL